LEGLAFSKLYKGKIFPSMILVTDQLIWVSRAVYFLGLLLVVDPEIGSYKVPLYFAFN